MSYAVQSSGNMTYSWATLTDGAAVTWANGNKQNPLAKLTSTQSFTLTFSGIPDGAHGVLKLTTGTASAITMTFDPAYTHKALNTTFTTYTFPALSNQEYFLSFVVDGSTIEWIIGDATTVRPYAKVARAANQTFLTGAVDAISWDTETHDNSSIWTLSPNPTRLLIPGTGNKVAMVTGLLIFSANATGTRSVWVYKNGVVVSGAVHIQTAQASGTTIVQGTFIIDCDGGDYLELRGQQSGGTLTATGNASIIIFDR